MMLPVKLKNTIGSIQLREAHHTITSFTVTWATDLIISDLLKLKMLMFICKTYSGFEVVV